MGSKKFLIVTVLLINIVLERENMKFYNFVKAKKSKNGNHICITIKSDDDEEYDMLTLKLGDLHRYSVKVENGTAVITMALAHEAKKEPTEANTPANTASETDDDGLPF